MSKKVIGWAKLVSFNLGPEFIKKNIYKQALYLPDGQNQLPDSQILLV